MHALVTCKNEDDRIKNEGARVFTIFSHYKSMGIFLDAQGLVRDVMDVLVTSKYEEDQNEGARVFTSFYPLLPYGSYPFPWKPEFQSDLAQNQMQPFFFYLFPALVLRAGLDF